MTRVHPVAAQGFARAAAAYDRGRPSYPREALDWLVRQAGLGAGDRVVDVGAGTGKLSAGLVQIGLEVIAVEPLAEMRAVLSERLPSVRILDATAEELPLEAGSVAAVVAAQAYHWFAADAALTEFHRVLRAGGTLALVWNARDRQEPLWRELDSIIGRYRDSIPKPESADWRRSLAATGLFRTAGRATFPNVQRLDVESFIDRIASMSFVSALAEAEREAVLERVRRLAERAGGPLELSHTTEIDVFERL